MHSNKFLIHGAITCVYFMSGFATFLAGLASVFEGSMAEEVMQDPYTFVLPFTVILYDLELRRLYRRQERWPLFICKVVCWVISYSLFLASIYVTGGPVNLVTNVLFILLPPISVLYSFLLFKIKAFSKELPGRGPEGSFNNFQQMIQQRRDTGARLPAVRQQQQDFDEANFGGEILAEGPVDGQADPADPHADYGNYP